MKIKKIIKSFDCGDVDLNDFILNESMFYRKALLAVRDGHILTGIHSKLYFAINNKTGCRFLTVDAYADAVPFYQKNGFEPLTPDDESSPTRLLYFNLKRYY